MHRAHIPRHTPKNEWQHAPSPVTLLVSTAALAVATSFLLILRSERISLAPNLLDAAGEHFLQLLCCLFRKSVCGYARAQGVFENVRRGDGGWELVHVEDVVLPMSVQSHFVRQVKVVTQLDVFGTNHPHHVSLFHPLQRVFACTDLAVVVLTLGDSGMLKAVMNDSRSKGSEGERRRWWRFLLVKGSRNFPERVRFDSSSECESGGQISTVVLHCLPYVPLL